MKSKVLFFFLLIGLYSYAQQYTSDLVPLYYGQSGLITTIPIQKQAPVGSIYLNEIWKRATVVLIDSTVIPNIVARINLKDNKIELKQSVKDSIIYELKASQIARMKLGNYWVYNCLDLKMQYPELSDCDLIIKLVDGKLSLYKVVYIDILSANYNVAVNAGSKSDKYVKKQKYYILKDNEFQKYTLSRLNAMIVMEDKAKEVKKYAKENNLKFNKEEDVIKIFKYYNSLQ